MNGIFCRTSTIANGTNVNNPIYEIAMADDDLAQLPRIDMTQITRGKFIGVYLDYIKVA